MELSHTGCPTHATCLRPCPHLPHLPTRRLRAGIMSRTMAKAATLPWMREKTCLPLPCIRRGRKAVNLKEFPSFILLRLEFVEDTGSASHLTYVFDYHHK